MPANKQTLPNAAQPSALVRGWPLADPVAAQPPGPERMEWQYESLDARVVNKLNGIDGRPGALRQYGGAGSIGGDEPEGGHGAGEEAGDSDRVLPRRVGEHQ